MDSALERFLAQRAARLGIGILAVLATLAAWAPFLANDLPYTLVAADARGLERARAELVPLCESFCDAMRAGRAADAEADARALETRLEALEAAGGRELAAPVRAALARARGGDAAAVDALVATAGTAREALASRRLEAPRVRTFPLFAALDGLDVLAALAPLALLAAWLARRRAGWARALAWTAAPALLVAGLLGLARERPALAPQGALKEAALRGVLDIERAIFPPIPFGPAETNLAEAWRPPTWLATARLDADFRYVHGARAAQPSAGRPVAKPFEPEIDAAARHVLGTDALGRDVAARVLWGGRRSLSIATTAALLLFAIGTCLGAAAGGLGGLLDAAITRAIEVVLCFPAFFLVLCAVAWTDPDVVPVQLAVALVIAAVGWTTTARLVRAEALRVAASGQVLAARALGLHPALVLARHVLPNALGPGIVAFGFAAGGALGIESSLSFLGLGGDVATPTWGALVGAARGADHAWAWIPPGLCVFLAVLAWVLVAEAARTALEPRAGAEEAR
ncbi:MAG: ABC transporter permease [Planctomycetes bacterium]|nr:ABC transporter permease [Planctomycetota bacterium]